MLGTEAKPELFPEVFVGPRRPLLKWAGGKTQILDVLRKAVPKEFLRYAELFLGGGAFFWSLARPGSFIADSNPDLLNFYHVVRDTPDDLLDAAAQLPITKHDYYRIRSLPAGLLSPVDRAARFAYLNKTCFNGLYRVNQQGHFNTPFGGKTDVKVLDEADTHAASRLLRKCTILCADFTESLSLLSEGDFVYLDPPYLPIGGFSDFRRYTKDFFTESHHVRLAMEFGKLRDKGVKALLSNSATDKIKFLYKSHFCVTVMAARHINCNGKGRSKIPELLVANYPLELDNVIS
ncbi:MAG: Dam family site-specific DNA-(adenine-N6)-methyltransferase [Planctomycetes bacterium]|nr:Dam family site-specific DNA-(adenine-N6)-methyltransferase [Planctomycetota bacterium]